MLVTDEPSRVELTRAIENVRCCGDLRTLDVDQGSVATSNKVIVEAVLVEDHVSISLNSGDVEQGALVFLCGDPGLNHVVCDKRILLDCHFDYLGSYGRVS